MPDILISSAGAFVKKGSEYIYSAEFMKDATSNMIETARVVCGQACEITTDTVDAHYWNYKIDAKKLDQSWGDSIHTDFVDFSECALKMCVAISNAIDTVKDRANVFIGSNDEDGIAVFIEENLLNRCD